MGPTGVGKTEIARRLAKLCSAPFIKVEATKYTEVGYVGRDVESMIRDLMEIGINLVRAEEAEKVKGRAEAAAEERLLDLLLPSGDGRENTREKLRDVYKRQSSRRSRPGRMPIRKPWPSTSRRISRNIPA